MAATLIEPDYKNQYFQHPELTRIQGEPTTSSLITLQNEVKTNAMTVHATLGGGNHGHLGLVLSPAEYAQIPNTAPYVRPAHPGAFNIAINATQFQIIQTRETHHENLRRFNESNAVERTLLQQIVAAIEPRFLTALRDDNTQRIERTIPEVFQYLFDTYGDVTIEELKQMRHRMENLTFTPNEPVDSIFIEIDKYAKMCELAQAPLTTRQICDFGYMHMLKLLKYKSTLKEWNAKPVADQTWLNFKTLFRTAHRAMKKTGELQQHDGLNHTELMNVVSEGVREAIKEMPDTPPVLPPIEHANAALGLQPNQSDLVSQLNEMREAMNQMQQMLLAPKQSEQSTHQPAQQPYHNMKQNYHQYQQPQVIQQAPMMHQYQQHQPQFGYQQTPMQQNFQPFNQQFQQQQYMQQNQRGPQRARTDKYCWTHGACGHKGKRCKNKAAGHKDEATFSNKMGGSTAFCWST